MSDESYEQHIKTCKCDNKIFPLNSRKHLNILGDSGADGWWDWHIKEDFEYMSPKFWSLLGFDPKDKTYHPSEWQKLINQDDLKFVLENYDEHCRTRGKHPFLQDVRYTCADGSIKWIRCTGNVIEWDADGTPVRMIGTHTDVTNIKELEESMADQIEMFKEIFDHSIIGMIRMTTDGKIIKANKTFSEMLGYRQKELAGRFEVDFIATQDIEETHKQMAAMRSGEIKSFKMEKKYISSDNVTVYTNFRASIKKSKNKIDYLIAEVENITDKKNSRKKLEGSLKDLKDFITKKSVNPEE